MTETLRHLWALLLILHHPAVLPFWLKYALWYWLHLRWA